MSTGSTGSPFPRWQLAILIGAPLAIGLGYLYWRKQTEPELEDTDGKTKKKLVDLKNKSISIDGDDAKLKKVKSETKLKDEKKLSGLELALKHKTEGNDFFKNGKFAEAISCYDKAIEACSPTNKTDLSQFYQNRAAAYEQLKKWNAVKDDCTKALEFNPKYVKALHRRARAFENIKDLASCLEDITATCILEGFQNNTSLMLADKILKQLGREHAQEAIKNKKPVEPSNNFVTNYFKSFENDPSDKVVIGSGVPKGFARARAAFISGKYSEVVGACTEEIESSEAEAENKMEATVLRATFYLLTGLFDDAFADLNAVIDNPEAERKIRSNALIKRASLYMQTEKQAECFEDFAKAIDIDAKNADIYHHRGQVFLLLEQIDAAIEDFTTAHKITPDKGLTYIHKLYAEYRKASNDQETARLFQIIEEFSECIERYPDCIECYSLLAQVLNDQQQFQLSDEYFEKASKLDPNNATIYVHRGLLALQWQGNIDGAMDFFNKAIELDDKCSFAYETLGTVEVQRGYLDHAIKLFDQAINLAKSEMEMCHLFSLKDAAIAQNNVTKKLGLDMGMIAQQLNNGGF